MFPSALFCQVYEVLCTQLNDEYRRDRDYLHILKLAADEGELKITEILSGLLMRNATITLQIVRETADVIADVPTIKPFHASLTAFDSFLTAGGPA